MEIQDDTETLRQLFARTNPDQSEVESIHQAELDPAHALALMANPKAALKAIGVPVSDESRIDVTMKTRADRIAGTTLSEADTAARAVSLRRIIIIVIHYRNCDSDIIIFASR